MNKILFNNDGIIITQECKYWMYILTDEQWQVIIANIKKSNFHISTYSQRTIFKNDIIIFYIKKKIMDLSA